MELEEKMGTMSIPKLIISTSIPLTISLLINNLYNLVDSIFVAHISENALTGISMAAPMQMILIAIGSGLAVGLNALVSKALGEQNREKVKNVTSAAILMIFGAYAIIALICLLFGKQYFMWQANDNIEIYHHGLRYLRVVMLLSIGNMTQWVFDRLLIATGKSSLFLITLGTASVVNLILDPILIFGYLGLPALGTVGAGLATVIGQTTGGVLGIYLNKKKNKEIPIHFTFRVSAECVKGILKVGIPTAMVQGIMSVMGIFINTMLYSFSSTAVAIYGILLKVQNIAQIFVHGMYNALIPIVAYNFGARRRDRINESVRTTFVYTIVVMLAVVFLIECIPDKILLLFDASEKMLSLGVPAVRIMAVSFLVSSLSLVFAAIYQGFGKSIYSMWLSLIRQVVLLIPFLALSVWMQKISIFWMAFVIAEVLAIPFGVGFYKKTVGLIDEMKE